MASTSDSQQLFPSSLLSTLGSTPSAPTTGDASAALSSFALPDGYSIRPLQPTDAKGGMLDVLRVLTTVGEISDDAFATRFEYMRAVNAVGDGRPNTVEGGGGTYYVLVVVNGDARIVGTGAVVVERKFIHQLGLVGHIEDIAVAKDQQGKKLGLRIIQALDHVAEKVGCYKTILDCSEANEGFYVKCGYKRAGLEMAHYYEKKAQALNV